MIAVAYGAGISLLAALTWMAVPWRRLAHRRVRTIRYQPLPSSLADFLVADGWPSEFVEVMTNGPYTVTSRIYRNGTAQVWFKRKGAA